jgi:uncharacterized protein (TIGR00251 family)
MYIHVKAKTEAGKEEVIKVSADHYEIAVREPAKRNEANRRIVAIVREIFSGRVVKIVNGHHSPSKLLTVEDVD